MGLKPGQLLEVLENDSRGFHQIEIAIKQDVDELEQSEEVPAKIVWRKSKGQ